MDSALSISRLQSWSFPENAIAHLLPEMCQAYSRGSSEKGDTNQTTITETSSIDRSCLSFCNSQSPVLRPSRAILDAVATGRLSWIIDLEEPKPAVSLSSPMYLLWLAFEAA
ncbi:hypothetical protein N7G274_005323 [Stereocaulon virgatum]|uniref:Uncharacterized protein n=1 Tax=Stereocaulon virgatum TaxID=373712 RepID=A0ABR4AAL4_9LECA